MPVSRLKTLEKWLWSQKPATKAISASGAADEASCRLACSMRSRRTYWPMVHSVIPTKFVGQIHGVHADRLRELVVGQGLRELRVQQLFRLIEPPRRLE